MSYTTLTLELEDEVATITLNRPDKRNAISPEMIDDLLVALDEAERGPARVVILTGAGKAFCAGMDLEALRALATQTHEQHIADAERMGKMFYRVYSFPKPIIAVVNGPAIAGGMGLATLCDFTLAAPEAKFGYTEARIGFLPAVVSVFLLRQVGEKITRELLLTGKIFDAAEAHRLGLVTELVPQEKLMESARELAQSLIASSPASLRETKRLILRWNEKEIQRDLAAAIRESAEIRRTEDFREGLSSFLEKRAPQWHRR
ncbi:MAG TPA: enoyl-CoA hydratase-related protein [Candidatus Limnocylindrales bacterium]|nr:enoyl-CoA hydratase-related protein [Candidatus Limnocylindrales bacterium]